jgi:ABC-type transport system involved in multi-copper enzyme maturation permease subunit
MFTTLLVKEIRETIVTGRFFIAAVLCLILIPTGMYVTTQEYRQNIRDYRQSVQMYQQRSEGKVRALFKAEGYRPPSPLSVFASGLETVLPNKAVTSESRSVFLENHSGMVKISNESGTRNPVAALFGKMDFLFNVGFVLSIFAMLFTVTGITGEREMGTLKLIASNPVPKWSILAAKIAGNYLVFLLPFVVAFLTGLLILNLSGVFSLKASGVIPAVLIILLISILFLFCMFTFGTLLSVFSDHSMTAIVSMLVIWVVFALVIPKLSPMIAQVIKPVESSQILESTIQNARDDLRKGLSQKEDRMFIEVTGRHGRTVDDYFTMRDFSSQTVQNERKAIETQYDALIEPVRKEYADKTILVTRQLQKNHNDALQAQETLAMQISRFSPICCFTYILTDLAGNGLMEIGNFTRQAELFQEQVKQTIYDKYTYRQYGTYGGGYNMGFWNDRNIDENKTPVPGMDRYRFLSVREVIDNRLTDIALLIVYTLLFFTGAFVRFLKYDVR